MKKQLAPSAKAYLNRGTLYLLLVVGVATIPFALGQRYTRKQSTLTFAKRLAYKPAIEKVYWRHRIWPEENATAKPLLDAVMPQAELKKNRGLSAQVTGRCRIAGKRQSLVSSYKLRWIEWHCARNDKKCCANCSKRSGMILALFV